MRLHAHDMNGKQENFSIYLYLRDGRYLVGHVHRHYWKWKNSRGNRFVEFNAACRDVVGAETAAKAGAA